MSDQDNLRDRIAKVLDQNFNPDQYPIMAAVFRDYAQAIIDEFGLEVVSDGGRPVWKLQIVGKWEEAEEQEPRP